LRLSGLRICPLEGKTKPSMVAREGVIVYNNSDTRALLTHLGDFRCVCFAGYRTIPFLIVPGVSSRNAARHEVEFAFVPNLLSAVEKVDHAFL